MVKTVPIHIGIVGAGFWATTARMPILADLNSVRLVSVCSRSSLRRKLAKKMFHIPESFSSMENLILSHSCEAVIICTPNFLHARHVALALEQGLDVFVEKPLAISVEEANCLRKIVQTSRGILRVGYDRRAWANLQFIKKFIDKEYFGKIHTFRIISKSNHAAWAYKTKMPPEDYRLLTGWTKEDGPNYRSSPEKCGGGAVIELASHLIDQLLWLTNSRAVIVSCEKKSEIGHMELSAKISILLDCGTWGEIELDVDWSGKSISFCEVIGSRGKAIATGCTNLIVNDQVIDIKYSQDVTHNILLSFIHEIAGNKVEVSCSYEEATKVILIVEACYASMLIGNYIAVNDFPILSK